MISGPKAIRVTVSLLLLSTSVLVTPSFAQDRFHALIPLGADAYELRNKQWKGVMTLMASAESSQFEGMERRLVDKRQQIFGEDGKKIDRFPDRLDFRVTASFRSHFADTSPFPISATDSDQNRYLMALKFRVVVFHGLHQTIVEPKTVEMIGVPSEMPYDERIFRVSVDLGKFPLTDRVVLEVHDPEGGRICKFHLDLM